MSDFEEKNWRVRYACAALVTTVVELELEDTDIFATPSFSMLQNAAAVDWYQTSTELNAAVPLMLSVVLVA